MNHKVLFLSLWFLPQVGGMEMSSYEVVSILRSLGNEVEVVTADHLEAKDFDAKQEFQIVRGKGIYLKNLANRNKVVRAITYVRYYLKYYSIVKKTIT